MKALWWLIRISLEYSVCSVIAAAPVAIVTKTFGLEGKSSEEITIIIAFSLLVAIEILWHRLKLRRRKSVPAHPASGDSALHVSEPPRQTGNSVYVQLKPSACLNAKNYIMFDVETTGYSSTVDRIIEIGAIKCIEDQPVDSFTTFVNPDMHIPSKISRLTGITDADVENAPQFSKIAEQLMDFIGDLPLVAHNGSFDARMLTAELNFLGLDYTVKVIDTLSLARKAFPDLENHKLRTLIHALGLADHEQQHRALDDARIGHQLYLRCKEELKNK